MSGETRQSTDDELRWRKVLQRGEQFVTIVTFINLDTAKNFGKLRTNLSEAIAQLNAGNLNQVFYSVPFRLRGWSRYEWLYWFFIRYFQRRVNAAGIRRRIQHVPESCVPRGVTYIDPAAYIRTQDPQTYRKLARLAFEQLFPYIADPVKAAEREVEDFLSQQHTEGDKEVSEIDFLDLQAHLDPLYATLGQPNCTHVCLFAPVGTASRVVESLERTGFKMCS